MILGIDFIDQMTSSEMGDKASQILATLEKLRMYFVLKTVQSRRFLLACFLFGSYFSLILNMPPLFCMAEMYHNPGYQSISIG